MIEVTKSTASYLYQSYYNINLLESKHREYMNILLMLSEYQLSYLRDVFPKGSEVYLERKIESAVDSITDVVKGGDCKL